MADNEEKALAKITDLAEREKWSVRERANPTAKQMWVDFPNGYAASIVRGPFTYGSDEGLFEAAVMHNGDIVYDTPITDDVVGHMTAEDVFKFLQQVAALPPRQQEKTDAKV